MDRLTRERFGLTDQRWRALLAERLPPPVKGKRPALRPGAGRALLSEIINYEDNKHRGGSTTAD